MKRFLSTIAAVIIVINTISIITVSSSEVAIKHLSNFIAPIEIINPECSEMNWIAVSDRAGLEAINDNLRGNYYLTNDIDLSGKEWKPIGEEWYNEFRGTFDGQGHVIHNMTIKKGVREIGLFGQIKGAEIRNVGLVNTNIDIHERRAWVGGIAGYVVSGAASRVLNCYNTGKIVVYVYDPGYGDAYNVANVGGITGYATSWGLYVYDCYNAADITVHSDEDSFVGGIVGNYASFSSKTYVKRSFNTGNLTVSGNRGTYAMGIGNAQISECFNAGSITAKQSPRFMVTTGLGNLAEISDSYNMGTVTKVDVAIDCIWDISNINFAELCFDTIWTIIPGINKGMPILRVFEHMYVPDCDSCFELGATCKTCSIENIKVSATANKANINTADGVKLPGNSLIINPNGFENSGYETTLSITSEQLSQANLNSSETELFHVDHTGKVTNAGRVEPDSNGAVEIAIGTAAYYVLSAEEPIGANDNRFRLGDVTGTGEIGTDDALEILKFIVGVDNFIAKSTLSAAAANIIGGDIGTKDALEILKYIVGIPSMVD